ncbi:MAG: hypothetical protein ACFFAS_08930 [Promethearchaeota archaeon]
MKKAKKSNLNKSKLDELFEKFAGNSMVRQLAFADYEYQYKGE